VSFFADWWRHIANGEVLSESSPLWFCVALLAFDIAFAALAPRLNRRSPTTGGGDSDLHFESVLAFVAIMASATFIVRLVIPAGHTILNLQPGDFPQYILMFWAGVAAHRSGWAERQPSHGIRWFMAGIIGGLVGWGAIIGFGGALEGNFDTYAGGWHWQAADMSLWEASVCVSVSLGLVTLYRDRLDFSNALFAFLSANAFAVFVFHPLIVVSVTRLLSHWSGPTLVKFMAAWSLASILSFLFAGFFVRKIPGLRAIL
jgi:glucans biosynthesis protein C